MRRLYLIGAFVIAGLLFFITKDNFGGEDSRSFTNAVRPTALQIAGFALGDDDGRETNLSGKEAYAIYADEVIDHLAKVGAEPILAGDVQRLILGEVDELWDVIAIVRYPSRKAMYKMATNKEYMESEKHREAGLAGQLNIEIKDSNQFNF